MAPAIANAKLTLSYPLYAADFDPQNNGFLIVGGGGGEGRSGVANKIVSILCHFLDCADYFIDAHRHVSKACCGRTRRHRAFSI